MQKYNKLSVAKDQILPIAREMRNNNVRLAMIHAYLKEDGTPSVSYEYEVGDAISSITVEGERVLPSISSVYDLGAEWPEREIMELMDITFEGVDTGKRLFMPDSMLSGQGHILVTPMDELIKETRNAKEDRK